MRTPRWKSSWVVVAASVMSLSACAAPGTRGAPQLDTLSGPRTSSGNGGAHTHGGVSASYGGFAALAGPVPSSSVIVPDCVPHSGPPYEIGSVGSFNGDPVTLYPGVTTSAVTGTFCARATLVAPPPDGSHPNAHVCTQLIAPTTGIKFNDVTTSINYIPGVTSVIARVKVVPTAFSAYVCDDGVPGQIRVDTVIQATAVPSLFGTSCAVGPLQASVTGSFTGPLTDAVATLTSAPFFVAAVQPTPLTTNPQDPYCPAGLATATNDILGLPRTSQSGLTIRTTTGLYLPPPGS